jgi:hypothetical protein
MWHGARRWHPMAGRMCGYLIMLCSALHGTAWRRGVRWRWVALRAGKRRYDRKQAGFGGQTKPIFKKKVRRPFSAPHLTSSL